MSHTHAHRKRAAVKRKRAAVKPDVSRAAAGVRPAKTKPAWRRSPPADSMPVTNSGVGGT